MPGKRNQHLELHTRNAVILQLYADGKTLQSIGDEFNLSRQRVEQIVIARRPKRQRVKRADVMRVAILAAREAGKSIVQIEKELDVSKMTIYQVLGLKSPIAPCECAECHAVFTPIRAGQRFCCARHSNTHRHRTYMLARYGQTYPPREKKRKA